MDIGEQWEPVPIDTFLAEEEPSYNWLIDGLLEYGDRTIIVGREGKGKALDTRTKVLTTSGWKTMGELRVGDEVFGSDGNPTAVEGSTQPFVGDCYEVCFDDGTTIVADAQHLWITEDYGVRMKKEAPQLHTTVEIGATLRARDGFTVNHSVQVAAPLQRPDTQGFTVTPYVLGAWLGDGTSQSAQITCNDEEILDEIRAEGWWVTKASAKYAWRIRGGRMRDGFESRLRRLGVWGNKHIPAQYLRASYPQRLALLQGLMDTDGTVGGRGRWHGRGGGAARFEFSVCNEVLAQGAYELLSSLGIKTALRSGPARLNGREVGTRYRLAFGTELPVFRLPRKAERVTPLNTLRSQRRYITDVRKVVDRPVCCVQVAAPDGVFLVGEALIRTHNSTFLRQFGYQLAAGIHPFTLEEVTPRRVLFVDLENSRNQTRRALGELYTRVRLEDPSRFQVAVFPAGLDLSHPQDVLGMQTLLALSRPDLLVMGPMYKLGCDLMNDEGSLVLARHLDRWRQQFGFALLLEAHQPQETISPDVGRYRRRSPIGSSLWLRWPEFGICLEDNGLLFHFRGQRDPRDWPEKMHWGEQWPWMTGTAMCMHCNENPAAEKSKFCSVRCANAERQARFRAAHRERGSGG